MTFLPHLVFAEKHLSLRYRASETAQTVRIEIDGPWPPGGFKADWGPNTVRLLADITNLGGCGGEEFDPRSGVFELIKGPVRARPTPEKCDYRWEARVAGVCALSMRLWVEKLASAIASHLQPTRLLIEGSLPLDDTPASVTEREVLRWLNAGDDYPGEWGSPPFEMIGKQGKKDAVVKAVTVGPVKKEHFVTFEESLDKLFTYASVIANRKRKEWGDSDGDRYARSKKDMVVTAERFDFAAEPVRALFVNMLCRYHYDVTPLERVEITMPLWPSIPRSSPTGASECWSPARL